MTQMEILAISVILHMAIDGYNVHILLNWPFQQTLPKITSLPLFLVPIKDFFKIVQKQLEQSRFLQYSGADSIYEELRENQVKLPFKDLPVYFTSFITLYPYWGRLCLTHISYFLLRKINNFLNIGPRLNSWNQNHK